jgi:hypothetical protein
VIVVAPGADSIDVQADPDGVALSANCQVELL